MARETFYSISTRGGSCLQEPRHRRERRHQSHQQGPGEEGRPDGADQARDLRPALVIDAPDGFLHEWWSMFWDTFSSRVPNNPGEGSSTEASPIMQHEQQSNIPMDPTMPQPEMDLQSAWQFPLSAGLDNMPGSPGESLLAQIFFEEEHSGTHPKDIHSDLRLPDVDKLTLSKTSSIHPSHSQHQIPMNAQQQTSKDNSSGVTLGETSRMSMDSTFYDVQEGLPREGLHDAGMELGAASMASGWNSAGVDQIRPGLAYPVLNSLLPTQNRQQQFHTTRPHHQHDLLRQVMTKARGKQTSPFAGSSSNLGKLMPPGNSLTGTDGKIMVNGRQIAERQMLGPYRQAVGQQMAVPMRQTVEQKIPGEQTTEQQQQKDQLMRQQLHENSKKKKSSSNSKVGENALEAEVEKLSDDGNANSRSNSSTIWQRRTPACSMKENGLFFEEIGCIHSSKNKVLCCHFSSDGKVLAAAAHDKVLLWNMSTFNFIESGEGHSNLITDIRFKPSSTVFATSSSDRTVAIWDSKKPMKSLFKLVGHAEEVTSLDFHPRKLDLLSSCDSNNEIRLWNVNHCTTTRIFKGARRQVRFQPRAGSLLATASGNGIGLFDVETGGLQYYLEGHVQEVRSVCWDTSGKYIASVSEDSARVWSVSSGGKCIHEKQSGSHKFESCIFHPGYSQLVIIGSDKSLDLWNPTDNNKTFTVAAHEGLINSLAECSHTDMMASTSHDHCLKVWK